MESTNALATLAPSPTILAQVTKLVIDSVTSPHSKAAYAKGLGDFMAWYVAQDHPGLTKATVQAWAVYLQGQGLSASTINLRLSAVRKLAMEACDNGLMDPVLAGGIARVKGIKQAGTRMGNWLTKPQTEALLRSPDTRRLIGLRDRAMLALMVGCGLRRSEVSALTFAHVQQREGRWVIVDMIGKGNRTRSVPVPTFAKSAIDAWATSACLSGGYLLRPMNNRGQVGDGCLLPQNIMESIVRYGKRIGVPALAPHDLRRTFTKLSHKGGASLDQIQLNLGHVSIETTQRYLGSTLDLSDKAPCDRLGLDFSE